MKKVPLEKKILSVLEDELIDNTHAFLTNEEIAKLIYGDAYMKRTAYWLEKTISNCMSKVRDLAEENGMLVIPLRKPTEKDPNKKFRILGWKIYEEGDEIYIVDEFLFKKRKAEAGINSLQNFTDNAKKQGAITGKEIKKLSK